MKTVAIVGAGLIGASFALALRKAGFGGKIIGVSSPGAIAEAKAAGAIDSSANLEEACKSADLIYLSQSVDRIAETLPLIGRFACADVLVTDAGSVKGVIVKKAATLPGTSFIGGHPLAGKELRGAAAADADLFRGRPYVLTPRQGPPSKHEATLRAYLARMGAHIVELTAEEHDRATAYTSHLPQLLSTALASTLQAQKNDNFGSVFGPGLLDMTRLAMSSPELWTAILADNRDNVLQALDTFADCLAQVRKAVIECSLDYHFNSGRVFAESLRTLKRSE
jgi:prephenate dehydrogenase